MESTFPDDGNHRVIVGEKIRLRIAILRLLQSFEVASNQDLEVRRKC